MNYAIHFERWPLLVVTGFDTRAAAEDWLSTHDPLAIDCRIMPTKVVNVHE